MLPEDGGGFDWLDYNKVVFRNSYLSITSVILGVKGLEIVILPSKFHHLNLHILYSQQTTKWKV